MKKHSLFIGCLLFMFACFSIASKVAFDKVQTITNDRAIAMAEIMK